MLREKIEEEQKTTLINLIYLALCYILINHNLLRPIMFLIETLVKFDETGFIEA